MSDKTPEQIAAEIIAKAKAKPGKREARPAPVARDQGAALLDQVRTFLGRFVAYPSEHARVAHVLWIAHAHLMPAWESTPRIAFLSPEPASGKTRSMEVTQLLVPNAVEAVNVTPAYMFRKCGGQDGPPTILFDEIDTVFGAKAKEHEELRALLNSGHRRGATAGRCVVRGKAVETEEINSYAAVALAGLGWLPDTILSRSIIIRMRRRAPEEKIEGFRRRVHAPAGEALRRQLAGWAVTVLDEATQARPEMPDGVEDRAADVWEPLLAIADIAGRGWPERARAAGAVLVAIGRDIEPSLNLRLLADLREIFGNDEVLATKTILAELCRLEDAPWNDLRGKPISDNQLARRLRQYEVKPKTIRIDGVAYKGYLAGDLYDAWRRYLPPLPEKAVTAVASVASQLIQDISATASKSEAVTNDPEPLQHATPATGSVEACNGSGDAKNPHEMPVATAATPATAFPGNGGEAPEAFARVCDHCGSPERPDAPIQETWFAGEQYWLHRGACQDGFGQDDDLTIPASLRRVP